MSTMVRHADTIYDSNCLLKMKKRHEEKKKRNYYRSFAIFYSVSSFLHESKKFFQENAFRSGLSVKSIPWAPETEEENEKSNCLCLWYDGRGALAVSCEATHHFVCEIPLPRNSHTNIEN